MKYTSVPEACRTLLILDLQEGLMHRKVGFYVRKLLYCVEFALAMLTIVVLVGNLGMEAYRVILDPTYFPASDLFLHEILSAFLLIQMLLSH